MERIVQFIESHDLEWCANWEQENRFYCTLFIKGQRYSKPKGFARLLEDLFGDKFGGFRLINTDMVMNVGFATKRTC